ncbi:MAG: response regulator [SAR324 cluster bacterium]|nr:response regulator [SAR324 cluster bacterium]
MEINRQFILARREEGDHALKVALTMLSTQKTDTIPALIEVIHQIGDKISRLREETNKDLLVPVQERKQGLAEIWFGTMTQYIERIESLLISISSDISDEDGMISRYSSIKHTTLSLRNTAGPEISILSATMLSQKPVQAPLAQKILKLQISTEHYFDRLSDLIQPLTDSRIPEALATLKTTYFEEYRPYRDALFPLALTGGPYPYSQQEFLNQGVTALYQISSFMKTVIEVTHDYAETKVNHSKQQIIILLSTSIGSLIFILLIFLYLNFRVVRPITQITAVVMRLARNDVTVEVPFEKNRDEIGEMARAIGVFNGIAQQLREAHERFITVMDSLETIVYVADMTTYEIIFANKYTTNLFGNIVGGACWEKIQNGQSGPCAFCTNKKLLTSGGIPNEGLRWESRNTVTNSWYLMFDRAIKWIDGRVVRMSIATDITYIKMIEEDLRNARIQADAANQAKSRFLANMSHEIRTPLNAILGFSQILSMQSRKLAVPPEFQKYLGIIQQSGTNLSEMINNVLDLSKIEAGKTVVEMETLNLKLLVQGIFHIYKASADKKRIHFNYNISDKLPVYVVSDRTKLNQICTNLLGNAIKFTPEGKQIQLKAERDGAWILLRVEDQGIGISKEKQTTIFEAFEQAEKSTTRQYGGTGLGLAITKSLAELLGGSISLDSVPGQGSTFTVKIPLVEVESNDQKQENIHWDDYCFSRDNKILVVEDNLENQEMIKILFNELGLEIKLVVNGKEGIEQSLSFMPDLILMDIHMPGMSGIEVTQQIRSIPDCRNIPIVALSADAYKEQQEEAYRAGMTDYLIKPVLMNKLLPVLEKYLRQEPSLKANKQEFQVPLTKA